LKEVKQFSKSYILVSALYIVLGIVLLAWPTTSVQMICYGLGLAMIVMGLTYGIIFFTKENLSGFLQMDLVIGIVCLASGIFLLLNPTFFQSILPFAMGIVLLLGAIVKIQSSINMKRLKFGKWYLVLICALLLIVLGIILLCNVLPDERYIVLYIGICLIFDGLTNLISLICIQTKVNKLTRIQREHPDMTYEQLLDYSRERKHPEAHEIVEERQE
jgi:uncharacterized membrane protein HdeD (DUF308 family)